MNKDDVRIAKDSILRCLTEDFEYGRSKRNVAIFMDNGHAVFSGTDLTTVMDKVVLGLYLALHGSE